MQVVPASLDDIPAWLALAAEVEPLFGPMVDDPGFHDALRRAMAGGRAFCVREGDGPPGSRLVGGLLMGSDSGAPEIGWLAVSQRWQRGGVGRALVEHMLSGLDSPAEISVVTFADGVPGGEAARRFYEGFGFRAAGQGPVNPAGLPTQVMRWRFERRVTARAVMQRGDRFLMAQHHYMNPANVGKWSLPGGRVDPDDPGPEATLRRELREEFQLEVDGLRRVGTYSHRGNVHHVFHLRVPNVDLVIDPNEIAAVAWFTVNEVRDLVAAKRIFAPFMLDAILAARGAAR